MRIQLNYQKLFTFGFWLSILIFSTSTYAQTNYTLNGTTIDKSNCETLFGASVFLKGTTIGVVTNEYGFYSVTGPRVLV